MNRQTTLPQLQLFTPEQIDPAKLILTPLGITPRTTILQFIFGQTKRLTELYY